METTINTGAIKTAINKTTSKSTRQPHPFVLALVFTTVLFFGVRPSITKNTKVVVASGALQTELSESVANAVVHDLSTKSGLPKSELKIIDTQQLILSDRCSIGKASKFLCGESQIPGWQITVASGKKRWVYRTNKSGSMLKLDNINFTPTHKNQKNSFASSVASVGNG